ncbi:MAG: 6-phosphogluconolactonase, partial [Candidatus Sumerlaeota bacterium]
MVQKPTTVEQKALEASAYDFIYKPAEKIPALVVNAFPDLGRLVALRFIEWAQDNPEGVISLPTGKSPEHFILWTQRILEQWDGKEIQNLLKEYGIDPGHKPDMRGLHFVQIDEFYPINPEQQNSFNHYVRHFYIDGFGLDADKALLIDGSRIGLRKNESLDDIWPGDGEVDLTLRYRHARSTLECRQQEVLQAVDAWCMDYEERIRALGGIGFFLGGIGPDGHIAFNIRGTDHHSTTRLCPLNYETQAAAATDLGGIEVARKRLAITIGLDTITANPDCSAIIMAAGEAKAGIVADAIEQKPDIEYPATVLQKLPEARFYLTSGAAARLHERKRVDLEMKEALEENDIDRILIHLANRAHRPLNKMDCETVEDDPFGKILMQKIPENLSALTEKVHDKLEQNIARGMDARRDTRFLHTEPHHDDIMLGYFAHVVRHFRQATNTHHFTTLTSGFTSVSNTFMTNQLRKLKHFLEDDEFKQLAQEGYFEPEYAMGRNRDVWQYLDGVAANDQTMMGQGMSRRTLRNLMEVFEESQLDQIHGRIEELLHYLETQYPGKRDPEHIQKIKGMSREWEAECLWGYYGWK